MVVLAMVHFGNSVGLYQVLVRIPDVVDDPEVRLQDCVLVHERRCERELVAQRGLARGYVVTGGNVKLIEHVVIEVVPVRSDAGFFVGINTQRGNKTLRSVFVLHERVNVRCVGCRIASYQWRIHVTGSLRRSD